MSNFDYAIEKVLGYEGGYCNDPNDMGGETKFGICRRQYPNENIKELTVERAAEIYYRDYWTPLRLDEVDDSEVAFEIFDTAVNMGKRRAVIITQRALNFFGEGLDEDGLMGDHTLQSLNKWSSKDPEALFKALNGFQFMIYVDIIKSNPSQKVFARGWMKRIQSYNT